MAKKQPVRPITEFHRLTFEALSPLINQFDPGVRGTEGPIHSIPKEYWNLNRRAKRGEKDLTYNGHPWNRSMIGRNVFSVEHVRDHILGRAKHYFTGAKHGTTVFMPDFDEHQEWQQGLARPAWEIFRTRWRDFFGSEPYHRDSGGGYHAYPILEYPLDPLTPARKDASYQAVNDAYLRLQNVFGLLLLTKGNYSDFEVKGTITTSYKSGYLAALPICTTLPCQKRDDWNLDHLRRFREQQHVTLDGLNAFVDYLAAIVAEHPDAIEHHLAIKKSIKEFHEQNVDHANTIQQATIKAEEPATIVITSATATPVSDLMPTVNATSIKVNVDLDFDNPDSRQREHRVLMQAARQLGHVPTLKEAIDILEMPAPYWTSKRRKRVKGTLQFIAKTFDASLPKGSSIRKPRLDLDKYTTTFTHRYRGKKKIDPGKLSAFVAAVEWSLAHQMRGDGSVPRARIAKLTGLSNEMCKRFARFTVREGIFESDLDDYGQNQARTWKVGQNFPGQEGWRKTTHSARCSSIELRRGKLVVAPLRSATTSLPFSGLYVGVGSRRTHTRHTLHHNSLVSKRLTFSTSEGQDRAVLTHGPPDG